MSGNPAWVAALAMFAERLNRPARTLVVHSEAEPDRSATMSPRTVSESISAMSAGAIEDLVDDVRSVLARCLLPVTPATLGYSLARIIGDDNIELLPRHLQRLVLRRNTDGRPLPARAVHLETHLFATLDLLKEDNGAPSSGPPVWLVRPDAHFRLSADAALVTGPFIGDKLAEAMLAHRKFVTNIAKHPLADTRSIRKSQPGRVKQLDREDDGLDYVAEARREAGSRRDVLVRRGTGWKLDAEINRLLIRVQKRVAQRRKRAGLSTTPPKGWRQAARAVIVQDLYG